MPSKGKIRPFSIIYQANGSAWQLIVLRTEMWIRLHFAWIASDRGLMAVYQVTGADHPVQGRNPGDSWISSAGAPFKRLLNGSIEGGWMVGIGLGTKDTVSSLRPSAGHNACYQCSYLGPACISIDTYIQRLTVARPREGLRIRLTLLSFPFLCCPHLAYLTVCLPLGTSGYECSGHLIDVGHRPPAHRLRPPRNPRQTIDRNDALDLLGPPLARCLPCSDVGPSE